MVRYEALKGFYELEKTIGCGGFAKVKLATHLATGEKVAIKIMHKTILGADLPRVKLELKALQSLSHENICKLYQIIETDTHFFIVMEYCSGGELFDHIIEKNRLTESESRMFFRQIVSAVAYLHSLGYAHRDLKPENILLDRYQNLKLIDFGLCAKPDGGMQSPLSTSCGSPTYAAPELVLGKQYLGSEVDVWAMGVLLYALLAGSLPFDDMNIDNLYRKIVAGRYEEPLFMSKESLSLIKSMLQADPKKRITINELLNHPWLTLGILDPVDFKVQDSEIHDAFCVKTMSKYYQVSPEMMWTELKKWKYDYLTATYFLLLNKKKQGSSIKLHSSATKLLLESSDSTPKRKFESPAVNSQFKNLKHACATNQHYTPNKNNMDEKRADTPKCQISSPATGFIEPKNPSSIRKPMKRIRSHSCDDNSPIPSKKMTIEDSTPLQTPDKRTNENPNTPGSARKVLGSIERSFQRVVNVFTPRKAEDGNPPKQPSVLTNKNLSNVSTTQSRNPEQVISELLLALEKKGIHCKRKGFILRGKLEPTAIYRFGECSFELEICYLPSIGLSQLDVGTPTKSILKKGSLNFDTPRRNTIELENSSENNSLKNSALVGIKRKRLKGDAWCYKKVCEEILALTAIEFKSIMESSV